MPAIERLSATIGATVTGIDLTDPGVVDHVHQQVVEHGVAFFPGQHLDADDQLAFAGRLGQVSLYPIERFFGSVEPSQQVIVDDVDNPPGTDLWHTDVSWLPEPPKLAVLTVLEVPEFGGDTAWASTAAAYQALSPTMQSMVDRLEAVHSCHTGFVEIAEAKTGISGLAERLRAAYPEVTHPLVRTHPDTGRRSLYLTDRSVMHRVAGMSDRESDALLDFLLTHCDQPRFQVRWRWSPGDVAIWDERTTLHRGISDHYPQRRVIRRCTVDGERPYFDPTGP